MRFSGKPPADLSDQDAHHHTQLVQGAKGSSEGSGRHLAHVHGSQAGEEPAEQADDQTAGNYHLVGGADGGEAHEEAADHSQRVDQEHGATPEEEDEEEGRDQRKERWVFRSEFSTKPVSLH